MNILLLTETYSKAASARLWFYQMHELLKSQGITVSLNTFDISSYDVAVVHHCRPHLIQNVIEHSPKAHIGIINPGYLGFNRKTPPDLLDVVNNVDFFFVYGFMWRELLLPFKRRVYDIIDYEPIETRYLKHHTKTDGLIIGYHGNPIHFNMDFFPKGANALKKLAKEHDFTLKVLTNDVETQPRISGVEIEYVEWELETFEDHLKTFDIGICPIFSSLKDISAPMIYIRNSNRVNTLLSFGIPSVVSPTPQVCHDQVHEDTALFAFTEEGWYDGLKRFITEPELRNRIGASGRKMVEKNFSPKAAVTKFINTLHGEIERPLFQKKGFNQLAVEIPSNIHQKTLYLYDRLKKGIIRRHRRWMT